MRGIIYKDYLIALMPKNLFMMLMNVLVGVSTVIFLKNFYGLMLSVTFFIPMCGTYLLQTTMEQDELSKFDKLQLTFPLTKKQIILSKYIGGLMMLAFSLVLSLLAAMTYHFIYGVADLNTCLQLWVVGIIFGLLMFSFAYLGFFLLGNKKGTIFYFVIMIIVTVGYLASYIGFDIRTLMSINHTLLLVSGLIIALLVLVSAYYLSVKIYTRRYS